jgi:hypothetical protein
MAVWRDTNDYPQVADEEIEQVEGIVRSEVVFAGPAEEGPSASRIVRWQAPLLSTEPPGIGDSGLHLPLIEEIRRVNVDKRP